MSDTSPLPLSLPQDTQPSQPLPVPVPMVREDTRRIVRAASIISLGNVASRVLGLVRETVKADLFGATGMVSAFQVAAVVPTILYDLLIGGIISSALVPVFSEYTPQGRRDDLWFLVSSLMSLVTVVLVVFVLLVELFAPQVAWLLSGGLDPEPLAVTARLLRITVPAVLFMTLSGIFTGLLYALRRFTLPAFTAAIFNASIVVVALVMSHRWGVASLAVGLLVGAVLQTLLQLPALRDARLRFTLDLRHPGLRRIARLYIPIGLSLVVSQLAVALSYNLASRTGERSIAWMNYAATLIQFPLGLVATAVSVAILPTLSRYALGDSPTEQAAFKTTLAQGLKLVLLLTIPATVGLFVLARPVIALLFEHGDFTPYDTEHTMQALWFALLGLVPYAVDQPLIFAFYARKDTWTPALVGVFGVGIYLLAALGPTLVMPLTLNGLILANSLQLTSHALITAYLLRRRLGGWGEHGLGSLAVRALGASLVMGGLTWLAMRFLEDYLIRLGLGSGQVVGELLIVGGAAGVGLITYALLMALLRADGGVLLLLLRRRGQLGAPASERGTPSS